MADEPIFDFEEPESRRPSLRRQYNLVTDTVLGPNVRWKDNLYQAMAILSCLVLGTGIGALSISNFLGDDFVTDLDQNTSIGALGIADRIPGAVVGGLIGLVVGFFGSGIFLMIYRAIAHARGRHD